MMSEAIVTIPPEVVRTLASSTVFVKASNLVNRDFAGIVAKSIELVWSRDSVAARSDGGDREH
jgi:hypothetical protein